MVFTYKWNSNHGKIKFYIKIITYVVKVHVHVCLGERNKGNFLICKADFFGTYTCIPVYAKHVILTSTDEI